MNRARIVPNILYPIFALGIFIGFAIAFAPGRAFAGANEGSGVSLEPYTAALEVCVADTENMLAYWPFDESAGATTFDDAIGANNGTCDEASSFCPISGTGKINNAFTFDGSDDKVTVPKFAALDWGTDTSFAIEAWVKIPNAEPCTDNKVIAGRRGTDVSIWLGCLQAGNKAQFSVRDSLDVQFIVTGTEAINDGLWHHIVGVRDADIDELRLYLDGSLQGTPVATAFTGDFISNQGFTIGYLNASPYYNFNGEIDEVALYNRAITAGEIQAHYLEEAGQSYCNDAPTVQDPGDQTNQEGDSPTVPITALDPDYGDTLTFSAPGLPLDLSINPGTGVISGTLTDSSSGSYNITVTATDSKSLTGDTSFAWNVIPSNNPPDVTNPGTQTTNERDPVSLQIEASDLDEDNLAYGISGQPAGLSIDSEGLISGTVAEGAEGAYTVTVTVTDDGSPPEDASVVFDWVITDFNRAPDVTDPGDQVNNEGDVVVDFAIEASDVDGDNLTFGVTTVLPPGLTMDASGVINGTISEGASADSPYDVTIEVTDDRTPQQTTSITFLWFVTAEPNGAPQVTNPGDQTNQETDLVSLQIVAVDPEGDPMTFTITGLPDGLSYNSTGLISGTLPAGSAGVYPVSVLVSDGVNEVTVTFEWTVTANEYLVFLPIVMKSD